MPPQTYQSGTAVPYSGTYALVRRSGHPCGISMWLRKGDRLPLAVAEDGPPLDYLLVGEPTEIAVAA
jgi:hypothetical protein